MSKTLDEIHNIREQLYKEEKDLSDKEVLKKIHKESEQLMKDYHIKLKRVENRLVKV